MKKLAAILILLSGVAQAQNICISPTGTTTAPNCTASEALEVAITGVSGVELPNDTYLTATDAAGTGTISMLKADGTDDTVLNCKSGELIKLSENGTAGVTLDPSTNGFTFASLAELGAAASVTNAISAAYFSDGTSLGLIDFSGNTLRFGTATAHNVRLIYNGSTEVAMNNTSFYPNADGGNALGASTNGWNGLYLSDGTDKWSFVPGTNLLTLAAGTSDGADDQQVCLGSGGACSAIRGSNILLSANEEASTGLMQLTAGNAAGGKITLRTGGTVDRLTVAYTADADDVDLILGVASTTAPVFTLRGQTADGDDDGILRLTSAGAIGTARGAYIDIQSNETSGAADISLVTGNAAGSAIEINAYPADGTTTFKTANLARFQVEADGDLAQDATSGGNIVMTKAGTYVKAPSFISDSTDVGWVVRAGADTACTTTCGANKGCLFGIDAGTAAVVACATATADTCLCSQ